MSSEAAARADAAEAGEPTEGIEPTEPSTPEPSTPEGAAIDTPAPTAIAAPHLPAPAGGPALSGATRLSGLRSAAIVAVFAASAVLGGLLFGLLNPGLPPIPWPRMSSQPEPAAAHVVAAALSSDDAAKLASTLTPDALAALDKAVGSLSDVSDVRFIGAVGEAHESFAGYLIRGKAEQGQDVMTGFVLHIVDGQVVNVNA